jgi:hypothetical protein
LALSIILPICGMVALIVSDSDAGWAVIGFGVVAFLFLIFFVLVFSFLRVLHATGVHHDPTQAATNQPPLGKLLATTIATILLTFLVLPLLEFSYLPFCARNVCRYHIFHNNPEICATNMFTSHCYIETAMYFSDPQFCNSIPLEKTPAWKRVEPFQKIIDECGSNDIRQFCTKPEKLPEARDVMARFDPREAVGTEVDRCLQWALRPNARDLLLQRRPPGDQPPWVQGFPEE